MARGAEGVDGFDFYDAACVALADLESTMTATEMTFNSKGREELYRILGIAVAAPAAPSDPAAMRAQMKGVVLPPTEAEIAPIRSANPLADLAAFKAEREAPKNDPASE